MAVYGGFNFTNFRGVNLKNTAAIRIECDGGKVGTLAVKPSVDADRAWYFPDKSGTFGVSGTVAVHVPVISAGAWSGTNVTLSGVRAEDVLVATVQDPFNTVTTNRPQAFLAGATPGNGGVHFLFFNPAGTATIYNELVIAYTIAR